MKPKSPSRANGMPASTGLPLTVFLTLCAAAPLHAASDTWLAAPPTGNWVDNTNWVGGAAPGATTGTANMDAATFGASSGLAVTVDAGRNIQNITFSANNVYTLGGAQLLLTSGGTLLANGSSSSQIIQAALQIQGDSGVYTIQTDTPGNSRLMTVSGAISGTSSADHTTTLDLEGGSTTQNVISGIISDGTAGGKLAVVKGGSGMWVLSMGNTFSGGLTVNSGTLRTGNAGLTTAIFGTGMVTMNGGTIMLGSTQSTSFVNDLTVADGATTFMTFRSNHIFNPLSMAGTGLIVLGHTNGAANTVTSANFRDFQGTVRLAQNVTWPSNLRLGTGFVGTSLQNAVVDLQTNTNMNTQFGTNNAFTVVVGTLTGATGSFVGGSGAGGGTITYAVGHRNEDSTFAGVIGDGGTKTGLDKTGTGVLTLSGACTYSGATTISGGTLRIGDGGTTGSLGGTTLITNNANLTFNRTDAVVLSNTIQGTGTLTHAGTGSTKLDGVLNYTGNTIVSAGTLEFVTQQLADEADVIIGATGKLNLNYGGDDLVDELVIDGVHKAAGTWGSSDSEAENIDNIHFAGTGFLTVATGAVASPYDAWALSKGLTVANNGAGQDPDFDGFANALEFVLGGNPLVFAASIAPVQLPSSTDLIFTFSRADESKTEVGLIFQYGSTLTGWTDVPVGAASAGQVTVAGNDTAPDTITVTIPKGAETRLFGRLKAVK